MLARTSAVLALLAGTIFAVKAATPTAPAAHSGPVLTSGEAILQIHSDSLTTYQGATTAIQDVSPNVLHRGAGVDGLLHKGSTFPLAIAGNPFGSPWPGSPSFDVDLVAGNPQLNEVDISLPADVRWRIGRSFSSRQVASGSHRDSNGYQGQNWFQTSQPEIVLYEHPTDDAKDVLYMVLGADSFVEFKRVSLGSDSFKGTNGAAGAFVFAEGATNEPDTYTYYDTVGHKAVFFGFDGDASSAAGQIWKVIDAGSNVAFVGDAAVASSAITLGYTAEGYVRYAYDSADRRFTYTYAAVDSTKRLIEVKAETKIAGTWTGTPTGVVEVEKVEYGHYSSSNNTFGNSGDLELVTITRPLSDSGVWSIRTKYFRYYKGAFDDSTNPGRDHLIRAVLDWEGARNLDSTSPYSWRTANYGSGFDEYLAMQFEYDSGYRVDVATVNGCGCGGGATGMHSITYGKNSSHPGGTGYDEEWLTRTIVEQPDGLFVTQYFDEVGQALSLVKTDGDPSGASPQPSTWATRVERNSAGVVNLIATPANESSYTHSSGTIEGSSSAGLITTFDVESSLTETKNFILSKRWQEGTGGTAYYATTMVYGIGEIAVDDTYVAWPYLSKFRVFHTEDSTGTDSNDYEDTDYSVTFRSNSLSIERSMKTHPPVSTANNGSGVAVTESAYFDEEGHETFSKSPSGIIDYLSYTDGQLTTSIQDADTANSYFSGLSIPTGFTSDGSGDEEHLVSAYTYDAQGRQRQEIDPHGDASETYYSKLADERFMTLRYPRFELVGGVTDTWWGPVSFSVINHAGDIEASGMVALSGNKTTLAQTSHVDETQSDPVLALTLGTVLRYSTSTYNATGKQLAESRRYFDIPASGSGADGTNYDPTKYSYDSMGRRIRTLEASGTITRTIFDALGRGSSSSTGTDDTGLAGGMTGGTSNMVTRAATVYDSGNDGGNGLVTRRTRYVDGVGINTDTTFDVRGRPLLVTNPVAPHQFYKYDNLGRQIAVGSFSSTASINVATDDPTTEATNRLGLSESSFDARGRTAKRKRHEIASDGTSDSTIATNTWLDEEGRVIKTTGASYTKASYDRLGRRTHSFILGGDNDTAYADADDVTGDIVLEETQTAYQDGKPVMSVRILRHHDDDSTGTTGPLDTNADNDPLKLTASDLKGRASISATWYETDLDRVEATVNFGTYGGATFDRNGMTLPSRSDTALVTSRTYGTDGHVLDVTDPKGHVTRTEVDDLGRTTAAIRNYGDGSPSGTDSDQRVTYDYTDGLRTKITADVPAPGTDQVTTYSYGTTKGTNAGDSEIATGHLLKSVAYPDSTGAGDVVSYAYDTQGRQIWTKDQSGNIIETTLDDAGRQTARAVTTLASGFDGAVRRIATSYTNKGQRELVTQYDAATAGSVVDEVKYEYERFGGLKSFRQDVNGAIDASGSVDDYSVDYQWARSTGGRTSWRKTGAELPSGKQISYVYGSGIDDEVSRLTMMKDGSLRLASYEYLGYTQVVSQTYAIPDLYQDYSGSTSGSYPGFDRFGRVARSKWSRSLTGSDIDLYDTTLSYDRASNIVLAEDAIIPGRDVDYTMDNLDRLTQAEEGSWSGSAITSQKRDEAWTLGHLGNWDAHTLDLNGDSDYLDTDELDEERTHNAVNELQGRNLDGLAGDEETLTYNAAGELTDDGADWKYVYDAFGRLREVKDQSSALVAEYRYNGLGYQIAEHADTDVDSNSTVDAADPWYYNAFDERWRKLATFRSSDTDPKEEFVPHQAGLDGAGGSSYINDMVLRDKDDSGLWTDASDGVLEQRMFYLNNWRGDVVAMVTSTGYQAEMVRYSAYGTPFGYPGGDCNEDGIASSADRTVIIGWIAASTYDVRGDLDLDGDVDSTDSAVFASNYTGTTTGRGVLSAGGNEIGYAGMMWSESGRYLARHRWHDPELGRWERRDPLGYRDSFNLHEHLSGRPISFVDPFGLSGGCMSDLGMLGSMCSPDNLCAECQDGEDGEHGEDGSGSGSDSGSAGGGQGGGGGFWSGAGHFAGGLAVAAFEELVPIDGLTTLWVAGGQVIDGEWGEVDWGEVGGAAWDVGSSAALTFAGGLTVKVAVKGFKGAKKAEVMLDAFYKAGKQIN